MTMRSADFRVESTGSGPDLALLHGWGMHSGWWSSQVDWLSKRYRVHLVDLPGHGVNHAIELSADPDQVAAVVAAHLPPCHLVAWSLGGLIAMKLALNHRHLCHSLTLVASQACFVSHDDHDLGMQPEVVAGFAHSLDQDTWATLKRFIALEVHGSDTMKQDLPRMRSLLMQQPLPDRSALQSGLKILQQTDLSASLGSLECPCLLIGGGHDRLVRPEALEAMRDRIEGARLCMIPSAGHAPFIGHPKQFRMALESFLESFDHHA